MHFPLNALSRFEPMTAEEHGIVQQRNRKAYSNPLEPATEPQSRSDISRSNGNEKKRRDPDDQ
jgi:hypothetical protein